MADNYTPFGKEWEKMLMRKTKKEIIRHLKAIIEQKKDLRIENEKLKANLLTVDKTNDFELREEEYKEIFGCLKICKTLVPTNTEIYEQLKGLVE